MYDGCDVYKNNRLLFEAAYALATGKNTITVTDEREIDRKGIQRFTHYLGDAKVMVVLEDEAPYITRESAAKLIGAHVGQKTTRAILKYLKRERPDLVSKSEFAIEYSRFCDAISPYRKKITYKVSAETTWDIRWIKFETKSGRWFMTGGWVKE